MGSTERSATQEEIKEWEEEQDEPHPVFDVPHRPERQNLSKDRFDWYCSDCGILEPVQRDQMKDCPECDEQMEISSASAGAEY